MAYSELDLDTAVQQVLKNASRCSGIYKGLGECHKAIEQQKAVLCLLAENCDEKSYTVIIEALCRENEVPLIKVWSILFLTLQFPDNKKLGEFAGLCKYDKEGKARKVVAASCVVVSDIGEESSGWKYLVDKYRIPLQSKDS